MVERKKSKCDYHFDRALAETEIEEIQLRVNNVIRENMKVLEEFMPRRLQKKNLI